MKAKNVKKQKERIRSRKSVFARKIKDEATYYWTHIHEDAAARYDQIGFRVVNVNISWKWFHVFMSCSFVLVFCVSCYKGHQIFAELICFKMGDF
jgi:hypothetical protein